MKILFKAFIMLTLLYCPDIFAQNSQMALIDSLISSQFKDNEPGGVVLVSKNGNILYNKAFGMANMELDVPMDDDMVFYIGSNTKQMTAVAILQLLEKGKLSLSDSLGKFLDCTPPVSYVTIKQLLSHTSGLNGEGYRDSLFVPEGTGRKAEAERYAARNMAFEAGTRWEYNNANYQILGYIIEEISGKTYEEYMKENVFLPAKMNSSSVANDEVLVKRRPAGYSNGRRGILNMKLCDAEELYASGGVLASTLDMYHWNEALKSGVLLDKNVLQQAYMPQKLESGEIAPYGFGRHLEDIHGSRAYRHGGAVPGFISETLYLPEEDVYVVMLLNSESGLMSQAVVRMVAAELIGKPFSFVESEIEQQFEGNYAGVYENENNELINITEIDGKVFFQRPGGRKYEIRHSAKDQFFFDFGFLRVDFLRSSGEKVDGLVFSRVGLTPTSWNKISNKAIGLSEKGDRL